jgi:hypothetical protein
MGTKTCRGKCGQTKPVDQFYEQAGAQDGRRGVCIACWKEKVAERTKRAEKAEEPPQEGVVADVTDSSQTITLVSRTVRTLAAAIKEAEIDTDVWDVERYLISKWDQGMKLKSHRHVGRTSENDPDQTLVAIHQPAVQQLWKVQVWLKRKVPKYVEDGLAGIMRRMEKHSPKFTPYRFKKVANPHMLEISICDAHLSKMCWAPESGDNFDLKIAESIYRQAVERLVEKSSGFNIDKILLPVGNDFFHVDGPGNMTTNGTPQDVDGRFHKMFEVGQMAVVGAVEFLRRIAPVEIILVAGNHDRVSSYHLVHTLKAWFRHERNVTVDDGPSQRKYILYGNSMILFSHGDEEKHSSLPAIMATERPDLWHQSKFRSVHLGHFHKRKETSLVSVDTHDGVVISILPSLSGRDAWHARRGYIGVRAADAYIYSKANGPSGYVTANVVGERMVA